MADPAPATRRFHVGDRVTVRYHRHLRGKVVEYRGPLGPGGVDVYRVRFKRSNGPYSFELMDDQLIPLPARPKSPTPPADAPGPAEGNG